MSKMRALEPAAAAAVKPRQAATTLVLRDSVAGLEVLMVRRSPHASFMPGAYVFPGGAVDAADNSAASAAACDEPLERLRQRIGTVTQVGDAALGYAVAALRECFEECGLWLGGASRPDAGSPDWLALRARLHAGETLAGLVPCNAIQTARQDSDLRLHTRVLQPWSHWVTPFGVAKRFDTLFFVAPAPPDQVPTVDATETTTLAWVHPPMALSAHAEGAFPMEFATLRTVESLQPHATSTVAALLAEAGSRSHLPPLHPRLRIDPERRVLGVLLPGQPGYEDAMAAPAP